MFLGIKLKLMILLFLVIIGQITAPYGGGVRKIKSPETLSRTSIKAMKKHEKN